MKARQMKGGNEGRKSARRDVGTETCAEDSFTARNTSTIRGTLNHVDIT